MKTIEETKPAANGIKHVERVSDAEAEQKTKSGAWRYIPKHIWKAGRGAY